MTERIGTACEVPLSRGFVAVVDAEDYEQVMAAGPWHAVTSHRVTYARRCFRRNGRPVTQSLHRFLTGWTLVDHRNGDGLDNTRANLREATQAQNARNARARAGTSLFKGVSRNSGRGRPWKAEIRSDGSRYYLGFYDTQEEAARAYDVAATELHGEFAWLNFPTGVSA